MLRGLCFMKDYGSYGVFCEALELVRDSRLELCGPGFDWLAPVFAEVSPCWIDGDDQGYFPDAIPAFEFLLAIDGGSDEGEFLEVHELVDAVAGSEGPHVFRVFVFPDAAFEFACYADVEALESAGKDVGIAGLFHWALREMSCWCGQNTGILRFTQNDASGRGVALEASGEEVV
jgi:hypothetical protein